MKYLQSRGLQEEIVAARLERGFRVISKVPVFRRGRSIREVTWHVPASIPGFHGKDQAEGGPLGKRSVNGGNVSQGALH